MRRTSLFIAILVSALLPSRPGIAGFPSTETFLPAVGRVPGQGGAQFYTTIWATNLTSVPVSFTFDFLKQNEANSSPASFADTLAPGQTKVYENVVESKLGLTNVIGAARVTSTGEILVAERIYNQPPGADVGNSQGLFLAGVPKSFSISLGQSASIQGINQGGAENFRYNFALVETGGGSPTVNVQLFDGDGALLGQKAYVLQPYEQIQPNVADITASVHTTNARIAATVTGGTGSVLLAGAQLANVSQDSSGFEMSFRNALLATSTTTGVSSLNSLTGSVSLLAGKNVTLTTVGNGIRIDAAGGSAGGGGVTSLNALTGALSIKPGNGISVTPSGSSIQVAYTGGGTSGITSVVHDATLAGQGTGPSPLAVSVPLVLSTSAFVNVLTGQSTANSGSEAGVLGTVVSSSAFGVHGHSGNNDTDGYLGGNDYGVYGIATDSSGVGVLGSSASSYGVRGVSSGSAGVFGSTSASGPSVEGDHSSGNKGYLGGPDYGVFGTSGSLSGILGDPSIHAGVHGVGGIGGLGVFGEGSAAGLNGSGADGVYARGSTYAGEFSGDVSINGTVHTSAAGSVKFDDPRDPANGTITYAFVSSAELKNITDGVITLGPTGVATVRLPDWFETLNGNFRYQLTAIGTPQPGLYVSKTIAGNAFTIAGGAPGADVSWQVTGVRRDPWASAHPLAVEERKSVTERGYYIRPDLYGQPPSKSTDHFERERAAKLARATSSPE